MAFGDWLLSLGAVFSRLLQLEHVLVTQVPVYLLRVPSSPHHKVEI